MCRREIGSEFHLCENNYKRIAQNNIFEYLSDFSSMLFDSGRSALRFLLKQVKHKNVLLPGYICESVRQCFGDDCNVYYYNITSDFTIDWNDLFKKSSDCLDVVYLHFFNGYIGKEYDFEALQKLKEQYGFLIIEDTTHSFLSNPNTVGDFCVASLRKWFPIPDGGILYTKKELKIEQLPTNSWAKEKAAAMKSKTKYLQGLSDDKQAFLDMFSCTENTLDNQDEPFSISQESNNILQLIDCKAVAKARKQNYETLKSSLNCDAVAYGGSNQVPLFYTASVNQRDKLRAFFTANSVYCPVHWPLYDELSNMPGAVQNYEREISIPIDQRYTATDMQYIVKVYHDYIEQEKCK